MSARISSAVARHAARLLGVAADLGELGGPVERDPAHQLRRDVVLRLAAGLPDPLVGLPPDLRRALGLRLDDRPQPPRQTLRVTRVEQDRVEHRAEDVVLALVEGAVADPHRSRARIAGEVVAGRLGQVAAAVDPVHDLQRPVLGRLDVGDELHELVGLPVEVEPVERLQREGRVAHPGVAVVPVALAARRLRQRGRERRDRRAGRHVRQALDRQRRALDRVAEAVVGDPRPPEPGPPEACRRGDPRLGLVDARRGGELLGPGERAERALSCFERVPPAHAVALDAEREVGAETDRLAGAGRVGGVPVVADKRPRRRLAAVVERRLADELELDLAVDALDRPHQHVVAVVVGRRPRVRRDRVLVLARPHRQRVAHHDPAGRRLPVRHEHVGSRLVAARGGVVDAERPEPEEPGLAVEQAAEDARRSRTPARRASRSRRRPPPALPCGSSTGTRSRRSAGTATEPPRSAGRSPSLSRRRS